MLTISNQNYEGNQVHDFILREKRLVLIIIEYNINHTVFSRTIITITFKLHRHFIFK